MSAKKTNAKRHEFHMRPDGEFDEMWIANADIHIERMNTTSFWIGIRAKNGMPDLMLNTGVHRGTWYFRIEEDVVRDSRPVVVQRPRRPMVPAAEWKKGAKR